MHVGMMHRGLILLYVNQDLWKAQVAGTKTLNCFIPSEQNS